jgi:hypothetical protein
MMFFRWRRTTLSVFCALGYLLSGEADGQGIKHQPVQGQGIGRYVIPAKVGLENFTPDQQQWLWNKVEEYAGYLAFVQACGGHDPNFEARIMAAARNCATESAIQAVRAVFHKRLAAQRKLDPPGICKLPAAPAVLESSEKSLNQAVEDVAQACRSCLTCQSHNTRVPRILAIFRT